MGDLGVFMQLPIWVPGTVGDQSLGHVQRRNLLINHPDKFLQHQALSRRCGRGLVAITAVAAGLITSRWTPQSHTTAIKQSMFRPARGSSVSGSKRSAVARRALPAFLSRPFSSLLKWVKRRLGFTVDDSPKWVSNKLAGHVKRVLNREPPFGFIAPEGGGPDLYFNAGLLGDGKSWSEFLEEVQEYEPGMAPVVFEIDASYGKPQAKGVLVLNKKELKALDADSDGQISAEEMQNFLVAHPELEEASLTKREREYRKRREENEREATLRDKLFQKQEAAEEDLYKKRDAENMKAKSLYDEAEQLWQAGQKDRAKQLQAEAKSHRERARQYKQQATDLDWKHNEEMFEYVQDEEHDGQNRDGTWIDLHGLSADFAEHKTIEMIEVAKQNGVKKLEIITGAGNHSGKGGPMIRPRILTYLKHVRLSFEEESAGSVIVSLD